MSEFTTQRELAPMHKREDFFDRREKIFDWLHAWEFAIWPRSTRGLGYSEHSCGDPAVGIAAMTRLYAIPPSRHTRRGSSACLGPDDREATMRRLVGTMLQGG
ncbi:MAG: hypothetical protein ACLPKB_13140 [Xanthobacteraceae bacterium]